MCGLEEIELETFTTYLEVNRPDYLLRSLGKNLFLFPIMCHLIVIYQKTAFGLFMIRNHKLSKLYNIWNAM